MDCTFKITPSTVITSTYLKRLCNHYHQELCYGEIPSYLPQIRIRYVEDQGKFGYAEFGNFFFFADDLYVWRQEKEYADRHNEDVLNAVFDDKCTRQGYVCRFLYAGADTNFVDSNGEHIFVGDVLEIKGRHGEMQFALGYFPIFDVDDKMTYCFVLDNFFLSLEECVNCADTQITRIGTTYFQLDWNFETEDMNNTVRTFNGWRDTNEEHENKVFMAKYTPNFDMELWKYHGLEILGVEYDWR